MLYRNLDFVNKLFMLAAHWQSLESLFITTQNYYFDEWANVPEEWNLKMPEDPGHMTGIVTKFGGDYGLKTYQLQNHDRGYGPNTVIWDMGECKQRPPYRCAECAYDITDPLGQYLKYGAWNRECAFCHYQGSKEKMDQSLQNTTKYEDMLNSGKFRCSWDAGYDYLTDEIHPAFERRRKRAEKKRGRPA